jgi:hypothetical protein
MIGAGLAALAAAAVIAVAPGGAVKLALAASGLGLGALGLAALVTLKTRRIVLNLIKRIESYERESAKREITLIEMSARVDELEYQRLEQDRPAEPRRRADAG